ncbi:MAG: InlB B-repeat-containing protein [Oscillospiraceae bacterium]|jgi:uncharacterized repeat protein (TIGR02543 family)|nr:InlB B-repeat-containing protein [Oscillospiraceae bacterium]
MATIHITDQAGLAAMTDGNDYILDNDITLNNWPMIIILSDVTIDGQGHTISGLTEPLVGTLRNSIVKYLTLNVNISANGGAIATNASGVTIENNTVNGAVYGAGFIRIITGDNNYVLGNTNNATITGSNYYTAGIIGSVNADDITIDGNVNNGRVNGGYAVSGGIVAMLDNISGVTANYTVTNNVNYGEVNNGTQTGGIVGETHSGVVSKNKNYGVISGWGGQGGVVGVVKGADVDDNENYANVTASGSSAGGIIGSAEAGTKGARIVGNKSFCGTITANGENAGGIVGYANGYETSTTGFIEENQSFATKIITTTNVGRIVGLIRDDAISPDWVLSDNYSSPDTLLVGNNLPQGGIDYNNATVDPNTDPQYGDEQIQGANISCPQGEYLDGCNGCVRLGDVVVDFDSNGGTGIPPQELVEGDYATEPPTPTRDCDIFLGWFFDDAEQPFDFETTPITENITLHAQWLDEPCPPEPPVKKLTVKFNSCGGSCVANQIVSEGEKAVEPKTPIRCGYVFVGWYSGCKKYDFNAAVTKDVTLYAKWARKCGR